MRIQAGLWAALAALLLTLTPGAAAAAPGGSTDDPGQGAAHRSEQADAALEAARELFSTQQGPGAQAYRGSGAPDAPGASAPEDATVVLHELAQSLPELEPAQRRAARAILARPDDGRADPWPSVKYDGAPTARACSTQASVCLHWVTDATYESGVDRIRHAPPEPGRDRDGDGVPDSVEPYRRVVDQVWQRIVGDLGYRPPPADADGGGTDIYLAELRRYGMYGYCALENLRTGAAYCVLDNDFEGYLAPPGQSLRVTAAHEFFHAVQWGYSTAVDTWVMEGTAAWVEDEVYDGINDNLQYLSRSALSQPGASLDRIQPYAPGDAAAPNWLYGSWVWWRFLSEYLADGPGRDPSVVRDLWRRLDQSGADEGVLVAQAKVLRQRGTSFRAAFDRFGAVNRIAPRWYQEGRSYTNFVAREDGRFVLQRRHRTTGWRVTRLNHLSTRHAIVRPGESLRGRWKLRLDLDLPPRLRGSEATVTMHLRNGHVRFRDVRLDRKGNGQLRVTFNRRRVARVAVSLTNASTRMAECGRHAQLAWTCHGRSRDDGLPFAFRATAVR